MLFPPAIECLLFSIPPNLHTLLFSAHFFFFFLSDSVAVCLVFTRALIRRSDELSRPGLCAERWHKER